MNATNPEGAVSCLSDSLKVQPIMDAAGAICEMAVVGGEFQRAWGDRKPEATGQALRRVGRVIQACGYLVPLTMDHRLDVSSDLPLAEQLCQDLAIATVSNDLLPLASPDRASSLPIYPSAKVIFNVPLSNRLVDGADLLRQYHEFRPTLRVRLLQCSRDGTATPFGTVGAVGVRVCVPAGIYRTHKLQERFFSLLGQASRKHLQILAGDIKGIDDFNWLRLQPDVLFQGDVLSIALSLEYVQHWLTGFDIDWRAFQLGE